MIPLSGEAATPQSDAGGEHLRSFHAEPRCGFSSCGALLGVVTASLASWLIEKVTEVEETSQAATRQDVEALTAEVAALREQITATRRDGPVG
jgi:hypothetical protein